MKLNFKKNRVKNDHKDLMLEFSRSLKLISDISLLKDYIAVKLKEASNSKQVHFFLLNVESNLFYINGDPKRDRETYLRINDNLVHWLNSNETHLDVVKNESVKTFLGERENQIIAKLDVTLIYPLRIVNQLKGIVMISNKVSNKKFISDELNLLSAMIDQATFAMENAFLYQQQSDRLRRMYHADKMAIMGQLAAGAAHEIRNPLTSIRSTIQYIKKDIVDPEKNQLVDNLMQEVDRINEIIQGLLSFSKPNNPQMETVRLNSILENTIQLIANTAKKKNTQLIFENKEDNQEIKADPGQLKQVLLNILINSIQSVGTEGEIRVSIEKTRDNDHIPYAIDEEVYIIIKDNGHGIDHDNLDKIFDPFYTTKSDGTGLGLSISYGIINKHGGDIKIKSEVGEGTTVIISLPRIPVKLDHNE